MTKDENKLIFPTLEKCVQGQQKFMIAVNIPLGNDWFSFRPIANLCDIKRLIRNSITIIIRAKIGVMAMIKALAQIRGAVSMA